MTGAPTSKRRKRKRRPRVVDAYRADGSRWVVTILAIAATLVTLGAFCAGAAMVTARLEGAVVLPGRRPSVIGVVDGRAPSGAAIAWGLTGLIAVAAGGGTAIVGLRRALRDERYLLLRKDGAVFVRGSLRRLVRWDDVEEVVSDAGQLVLRRHDGTALTIEEKWVGVSVAELASRVAQVRRRALLGLLR